MTALGGSCCARIQRLTALNMAVPLIPMPHMLIRPPVATRANPTTIALELVELIWMSVVVSRLAFPLGPPGQSPSVGDVAAAGAGDDRPSGRSAPRGLADRTGMSPSPANSRSGPLMTATANRHNGKLCT